MGLIGKVSNSITSLSKYVQHKNTDRLVKQVLDIADFEPIIQTARKIRKCYICYSLYE